MQEKKNGAALNFTQRCDFLAQKLDQNKDKLAKYIGISRATLFAAQSGKSLISSKTLLKLKAAEIRAGSSAPFFTLDPRLQSLLRNLQGLLEQLNSYFQGQSSASSDYASSSPPFDLHTPWHRDGSLPKVALSAPPSTSKNSPPHILGP